MPTIVRRGGVILGDGPHTSYIVLDASYRGDLFSWSEAWIGSSHDVTASSYDPMSDARGPTITGLQITGSTTAPNEQNALTFYDRNDDVLVRDVEVDYLNGQCLSMGNTKNATRKRMCASSAFYNLKCWNTGTTQKPAVQISSTTTPGSDATNELDFYKLAVFSAASAGVTLSNPNPTSATRRIRFFGLRVDHTGTDAVQIGAAGDNGQVAEHRHIRI